MIKPVKVLLLSTLLCGCGFQLQGTDISELEFVSLSGPVIGEVRRSLVNSLEDYGVKVAPTRPGIIDIKFIDFRTSRRRISTSARIDAAQYELQLDVDVEFTLDGNPIGSYVSFSVDRIYSVDSVNLSGSYEEQEILMSEMGDEVVAKIIRRLETWLDGRRTSEV